MIAVRLVRDSNTATECYPIHVRKNIYKFRNTKKITKLPPRDYEWKRENTFLSLRRNNIMLYHVFPFIISTLRIND